MDPEAIVALVLVEIISVLCIISLWRRHAPENIRKDVAWTLVLLFPLFGPLMWATLYGNPPPHDKTHPKGHHHH